MTCDETRILLNGYVDAELDLVRSVEVEQHTKNCARCTEELQGLTALRQSMRAPEMRFRAPSSLLNNINAKIGKDSAQTSWRTSRWAQLSYALGLLAVFAVSFALWRTAESRETLADQVVASHVRSLMASHLYDVESTDQHTVKPWFHGKLDFAPPVADFAAQGYPLVGGRLDVLEDRPVAAIIYKRRDHPINLFVWPTPRSGKSRPRNLSVNGYNLMHWTGDGMEYWLISDLNDNELRVLAQLLQTK